MKFTRDKKVPLLVRFLACFIILTSLLQMHQLIISRSILEDVSDLWPEAAPSIKGLLFVSKFVGLTAAIGLLQGQGWARKWMIGLGVFTILTLFWVEPFEIFKRNIIYIDSILGDQYFPKGLLFDYAEMTYFVYITIKISFWSLISWYLFRLSKLNQK